MPLLPRHGLYDPDFEHDACGVGFVAHIRGEKSRSLVEQGLELLKRLAHRAASGSDRESGDSAGILLQLPHRFFKREGLKLGLEVPSRRCYAVGQVFLPRDPHARRRCETLLEDATAKEGQRVLGWRDVPIAPEHLGQTARAGLPVLRQIYIGRRRVVPSAFERKLFVIRKLAENQIRAEGADPEGLFHVVSLSSETII